MASVICNPEASASTSTSTDQYRYQVFLSFRGEDTRNTITSHLYAALLQAGFHTFLDDDGIERGEDIKSELDKAIRESRISLVVLSKNYASSKWCLDELAMIIKRKNDSKHEVVPVFFHVDPSDVRKQRGSFGEAFAGYEEQLEAYTDVEKKNEWIEKMKSWRAALEQVGNLAGMTLDNQANKNESELTKKVVKVIADKLSRVALHVAPYLIEIHSRSRIVDSWLRDESTDVNIIGIWGLGGIGKTTIAKFLYNEHFERFDGSSFLADIRELSGQSKGLVRLQRQLLSDILRREKVKINSVDEGLIKISQALSCRTVLLVLDDVDHVDQLNAILGMRDWFSRGSKVIITTRHKGLVKSGKFDKIHEVKRLHDEGSMKLFSLHAFGQVSPLHRYLELTKGVVDHCEGLPLALQVLGSFLCGKDVHVWISAMEKLKLIPDNQIFKKLKISYDSLQDDHDKNIFLHVACFFVGKKKDFTVRVLDGCEFFTTIGLQNLIDRCLLRIDYFDKLMMHQTVQEMGLEIIRQESTEPGARSRLCHNEECFDVLTEKTGTESIQGLFFDMQMCNSYKIARQPSSTWKQFNLISRKSDDLYLQTDAFSKMSKLRILQLNYVRLTGSYKHFPKKLKWLCWHGFPLQYLPSDLPLENLVALDMSYSNFKKLWKGSKSLPSLKILNISYSKGIDKTPNFSKVPSLEELILRGCSSLVEVCESIGLADKLSLLDLEDCASLRKLPRSIHKLSSLQNLKMSGCSNLVSVIATGVVQSWAFMPLSLVSLSLDNCNLSDDSFPRHWNSVLQSLEKLSLCENLFHSLPDCIKSLSRLKALELDSCPNLQSVQGLPTTLQHLSLVSSKSLEKVTGLPRSIQEVVYEQCQNLLQVEGFFNLVPIGKVDGKTINDLGYLEQDLPSGVEVILHSEFSQHIPKLSHPKVLYEFGIVSTTISGKEIPGHFMFTAHTPWISFTVPFFPSNRIRGLSIAFMYSNYGGETYGSDHFVFTNHYLLIRVKNHTKDFTWIYNPSYCGLPENLEESYIWLSYWKIGQYLDIGDQMTVSAILSLNSDCRIEGCGINFVYDNEDFLQENNNEESEEYQEVVEQEIQLKTTTFSWRECVSIESAAYSRGKTYFFTNGYLITLALNPRDINYWFTGYFGNTAKYEDVEFLDAIGERRDWASKKYKDCSEWFLR